MKRYSANTEKSHNVRRMLARIVHHKEDSSAMRMAQGYARLALQYGLDDLNYGAEVSCRTAYRVLVNYIGGMSKLFDDKKFGNEVDTAIAERFIEVTEMYRDGDDGDICPFCGKERK